MSLGEGLYVGRGGVFEERDMIRGFRRTKLDQMGSRKEMEMKEIVSDIDRQRR